MNTDEFWQTIDTVHDESGGDMKRKCELLKQQLSRLSEEDIRQFIDHFDSADALAYSWPLWGAAYVIHGGCSDDAFSDFRATLISQGRRIYHAVLADPESLAELEVEDEEDLFYEGYQYVKNEVAEEKLGRIPERRVPFPDQPAGEEWDEDGVNSRYPRLAAKYGASATGEAGSNDKKPWWKLW